MKTRLNQLINLFFHPVTSKAQPTPYLDRLPDSISQDIIRHYLDEIDKSKLTLINKKYRSFKKDMLLDEFLPMVAFGGLDLLIEDSIKHQPFLLTMKGQVTLHTGQVLKGTPWRIARYLKDEEMLALLQKHMDPEQIKEQQKAQFPEGYEAYKAAEAEKIKFGFQILEDTFKAIASGSVELDDQNNFILDDKTKAALDYLRDYLKPKGMIKTGEDFTDVLTQKAFELYNKYYNEFSLTDKTFQSPKNILVFCQVVGLVERYLPINYIQNFADGLSHSRQLKREGRPQARSLRFDIWKDKNRAYNKLHFLYGMVSDSFSGLGYEYGIYAGGVIGGGMFTYLGLENAKAHSVAELITLKQELLNKILVTPTPTISCGKSC